MKQIILAVLLIFSFFSFSQHTTWKPAVKRMKKAEDKVMSYTKKDSLIQNEKVAVFLRWSEEKDKPYLLLIHGMGLNGSIMWHNQIDDLSKHFNLIIPDLVGYGNSSIAISDYSPEFSADNLVEAMQKVGLPNKMYVLGYSYGGLVAAMIQKNHGSMVEKLIVCDAPVKYFTVQIADSMAKQAGVSDITKLLLPQTSSDVDGVIKAMSTKDIKLRGRFKENVRKHVLASDVQTKLGQIQFLSINQKKYLEMDYGFDGKNTIIMWGSKDGLIPPIVGQKLHETYPESTLLMFEGGKHDIHVAFTKRFNEVLIGMVR
jgi:pimeloyl-ACP methyl ester carboxylesterase